MAPRSARPARHRTHARSAPRATARLLASLLAIGLAGAAAAEPYYRLDFEGIRAGADALVDGPRRYTFRTQGGGAPMRLVPGPPGRGQALQLRSAPTPPEADRDRAEIAITSAIAFGDEWFLGMSVAIEPGSVFDEGWQVLAQCTQPTQMLRSPPVSVDLEPDGTMSLVLRNEADAYRAVWNGPIPQGRWLRLVLGFRMGEEGRARLWVNGEKVADARAVLGWPEGEPRCSLKFGLYRGASAHPAAIRFDDVILGTDYESAARP